MKVRILTDHTVHGVVLPANSAPDLPEALAEELVAQGAADAEPAAVAYAETLGIAAPALPDEILGLYGAAA